MRNKLFEEALNNTSEESCQKIRIYTDMVDIISDLEEERDKAKILLEAARDAISLTAIAFGEWLLKTCYIYCVDGETKKWWRESEHLYYTTEELYQIFLKENQ